MTPATLTRISILFDKSDCAALAYLCEKHNLTSSSAVRYALRQSFSLNDKLMQLAREVGESRRVSSKTAKNIHARWSLADKRLTEAAMIYWGISTQRAAIRFLVLAAARRDGWKRRR